ncbi:hypothetical protein Xszus_02230 [Xenorhabdus szentirmaii]|uniref:Uncharacterized protein n=1 Tax=Xenorhabdus szentirmaii DSM 16338 TaxID=1427518 RepID=W1IZM3_9GAMM|nr:hypothetical protein Xsze_00141 [Xenorhabdus szentirmaii DSM 16338]PHM42493.1 hypothetical protein Xszus_02230 [Xenorhabdus szentirmaii]CDL83293.1 hypothetical protein XSR1_30147 [Xenorhabdus szentirmaii DSM 16338]
MKYSYREQYIHIFFDTLAILDLNKNTLHDLSLHNPPLQDMPPHLHAMFLHSYSKTIQKKLLNPKDTNINKIAS